jgi:hypothetical protein
MTDPVDPTEEMVKSEISAAFKIFKEDHIHAALGKLKAALLNPGTGDTPPTEGNPPPASDPKPSGGETKAKKGLWWGGYEDGDKK